MTQFSLRFQTPRESSIIDSVEWDEETKTMTVYFVRGDVYEYQNVTTKIINEAMNADSLGSYLRRNVFDEPKKFPFEKKD